MTQMGGRRGRGDVRRILVVNACSDDDRSRAIDTMRPCIASLCRHGHAELLFARAGLKVPDIPADLPVPYPDLGHAIDWEEAKRASSYVPDDAVEALVALGTGAEVAARAGALIDLDLDAIWWRDEATWTRPDALLRALSEEVLPRLRE